MASGLLVKSRALSVMKSLRNEADGGQRLHDGALQRVLRRGVWWSKK